MPQLSELTQSLEDYLEAIYELERTGEAVRVKDIADLVDVRMPSVSAALQLLKERGLVIHEPYASVTLTEQGRRTAEFLMRRHLTLTAFLSDILGLEPEQAEAEACGVEHALSPLTLSRLLAFVDFVERCPRGGDDWLRHLSDRWGDTPCEQDCSECVRSIIPPARNPFSEQCESEDTITLDQVQPGGRCRVVCLSGDPAIRRRIMDMGVTPGAEIMVERLAPLGDPIEIEVRGYHLSLRKREAAQIAVEPI